jgi:hypothetical protein
MLCPTNECFLAVFYLRDWSISEIKNQTTPGRFEARAENRSASQNNKDKYCFGYSFEAADKFKTQVDDEIRSIDDESLLEEDDECIFYPVELTSTEGKLFQAFTMYKRVDKKIKPVSTTFSPDYEVR